LIFDEVITGFGRLGAPFATEYFGVKPDMITMAKGLTNGAVPMGAVAASRQIYEAFMQGPEGAIELFHGYTYSAHPVACAAGLATQQIYRRDGLLTRAAEIAVTGRTPCTHSRPAARHRPAQPGPHRRDRTRVDSRQARRARLRRVRARIRGRHPDPHHRRHHRAVAALIIERSHVDELFGKLAAVLKVAA